MILLMLSTKNNTIHIGIIGLGFVGTAIYDSISLKIKNHNNLFSIMGYDKYKKIYDTSLQDCFKCDILFLSLPTPYNSEIKSFDYSAIHEVCYQLFINNYKGLIVIKSTVDPQTIIFLENKYPTLCFIHNPEFLSVKTAFDDVHQQKHIILGIGKSCNSDKINLITTVYNLLYPDAQISICNSTEAECTKIFCNTFYAVKIQLFNELYQLCQKLNCDYDNIVSLMLKNGWINPMHTKVPGTDDKLSYGGLCFPKDTNALLHFMKKYNSPCQVLEATINERNQMRNE